MVEAPTTEAARITIVAASAGTCEYPPRLTVMNTTWLAAAAMHSAIPSGLSGSPSAMVTPPNRTSATPLNEKARATRRDRVMRSWPSARSTTTTPAGYR